MRLEVWLPTTICAASFLSTLSVVVVGFMYSNSRLSDLREGMNQRFTSLEKSLDARLARIEDILRIK